MVSSLLKKYSPNAIRWLLLSNHWNKNWEYLEKDLKEAQRKVDLIENSCGHLEGVKLNLDGASTEKFSKIMDNNLNTPKALEFILQVVKEKSFNEAMFFYQMLGFKLPQKLGFVL